MLSNLVTRIDLGSSTVLGLLVLVDSLLCLFLLVVLSIFGCPRLRLLCPCLQYSLAGSMLSTRLFSKHLNRLHLGVIMSGVNRYQTVTAAPFQASANRSVDRVRGRIRNPDTFQQIHNHLEQSQKESHLLEIHLPKTSLAETDILDGRKHLEEVFTIFRTGVVEYIFIAVNSPQMPWWSVLLGVGPEVIRQSWNPKRAKFAPFEFNSHV
jgi:hypothetical protein